MNLIKWSARVYPAGMPAKPTSSWSRTWPRYRDNLARHLSGISRDLEARVRRCLDHDLGYHGLRPSFGPFFSLIWKEGRPITAIAGELAISKQACSQLATLAEGAGYLERQPNPEDQRSRLLVLTPRGHDLVEEAVRIILETESEYAARLGAGAYRRFSEALAVLYQGLGLPSPADSARIARASRSVGVLPLLSLRIQRELVEGAARRGHAGLKLSYGEVLPLVGAGGRRIHEVARLLGVSRQAISALAQELEGQGYLRREAALRDRRGVNLRLTTRGAGLIRDLVAALDGVEDAFRGILGARRFGNLQRGARELDQALDAPGSAVRRAARGAGADRLVGPGTREIQQLATRLRRQLGSRDAARLAALLEPTGAGGPA